MTDEFPDTGFSEVPAAASADVPDVAPAQPDVDVVETPMVSDSPDAVGPTNGTEATEPTPIEDLPADVPDSQPDDVPAPVGAETVETPMVSDSPDAVGPTNGTEATEPTPIEDLPADPGAAPVVDAPAEPGDITIAETGSEYPLDDDVVLPLPSGSSSVDDFSENDRPQIVLPESDERAVESVKSRLNEAFQPWRRDWSPTYHEASDGTHFSRTGSGGANFLPQGDDGEEAASYMKRPPADGAFEVVTHGTEDGCAVVDRGNGEDFASPQEFADLIRESGWNEGQPVRMAICHAGQPDGLAQQVADILKVPVEASPDSVWVSPNGDIIKGGVGGPLAPLADIQTFKPRN